MHCIDPIDFSVKRTACFHGSSPGTIMKSITTMPTTSPRMINLRLSFCDGELRPTKHTMNGYPYQRHVFRMAQTPRCIDAFHMVPSRTSWCWIADNTAAINLVGMELKLRAKSSYEGAGQCWARCRSDGCFASCRHRIPNGTSLRTRYG